MNASLHRSGRTRGRVALLVAWAALLGAAPLLSGPARAEGRESVDPAAILNAPYAPDTGTRVGQPAAPVSSASPALISEGRRLYVEGVHADGSALVADRLGAAPVSGAAAACVTCHKRSGMGGDEGDVIVPPINGPSLYAGPKLKDRVIIAMDPRRGRFFNPSHPPYDTDSLYAAIEGGVHVTGRAMHALMPRYHVDRHDVEALRAYLDQLSVQWSPGVSDKVARFATVITPDVSSVRKDAFLKSLNALFDQKNSNTLPGHRHMVSASEGMLNLERRWDLDVWQLQGDPATWREQLEDFYRKAPVFALVSGLGDGEWSPVQEFCERNGIPCWFPSVVNPPADAANQTYSLYFSGGMTLEAQVLSTYLQDTDAAARPHRLVQVLRDEAAARSAAQALESALGSPASGGPGRQVRTERRVIATGSADELAAAVRDLSPGDALVLWLRPADLATLDGIAPPAHAMVFASAGLGGADTRGYPARWLDHLRIIYPYELPARRDFNLATFHSWIELRHLPLVDEVMQSEVFFSVGYLMFTMTEMLDNVYRDCLIDRGETMVRRREMLRAEEEILVRQGGHPPAASVAARSRYAPGPIYGTDPNGRFAQKNTPMVGEQQGTTIYPHLALATNQRFASKGAYVVSITEGAKGRELRADGDWIVP